MTDLTEQWKKGELPSGYYYVYLKYLKMFDTVGTSTLSGILGIGNGDNIEVLAEVPSYELWKAVHEQWKVLLEENAQLKKWCEEFNALEVAKENTKLKELLKRARGLMNYTKDWACSDATEEMITKIDQVLGEE